MKTRVDQQSLFIRKSVHVLSILVLFLIVLFSTQATFAKPSVQQTSPTNLAFQKPTDQSSTFSDNFCVGSSEKAVDGNTDGRWPNTPCTVTHTEKNDQAWWSVDLGAKYFIGTVEIWNRTDCCRERLSNFDVLLSDDGQNWRNVYFFPGYVDEKKSIDLYDEGRYVKIQLRGTDFLSLAEVKIFDGNPADFIGSVYKDSNGEEVNPVKPGETISFNVGQLRGTPGKVRFNFTALNYNATSFEWMLDNRPISSDPQVTLNLEQGSHDIVLTVVDSGAASSSTATINIVSRNGETTSLNLSSPFIGNINKAARDGGYIWSEYDGINSGHIGDDAFAEDWNWGKKPDDDYGMVLLSPAAGKVLYANVAPPLSNYGNLVSILLDDRPGDDNPGDFVVMFAHLSQIWVVPGQSLCPGTPIGRLGDTGTDLPHAHISAWQGVFQLSPRQGQELPGIQWIQVGNAPHEVANGPTKFATTFTLNPNTFETQGCDGLYVVQGRVTDKSGKTGVSGADVKLQNASGVQVAITTTGPNGLYVFRGIGPGTYDVVPTKGSCKYEQANPHQVVISVRHVFVDPFSPAGGKGCK